MARSYKRPWVTMKSQWHRIQAARTFRRNKLKYDVADGMQYKRYYPMWDVIDYRWQVTHPDDKEESDQWIGLWWRVRRPYRHARDVRHYIKDYGNTRAHWPRTRCQSIESALHQGKKNIRGMHAEKTGSEEDNDKSTGFDEVEPWQADVCDGCRT